MITPEENKERSFDNIENMEKSYNDVTNEIVEVDDNSNLTDHVPDNILNIKSTLVRPKEESKKYGNRLIENCNK